MLDTRITIRMIETAINKGIRDIEDNPKRGIRNLVDLANHFASTPCQQDILELMQNMLINLDSPYYDIVLYLIKNVDHNIIKTFGINIGYNSWTNGAKKTRDFRQKHNVSIPWTIIFDLRKELESEISLNNIKDIINEGREIGIYSYMFFLSDIDNLSSILKENLDCAFILYIDPDNLTEKNIYEIKSYYNTIFMVLYQPFKNESILKDKIQLLGNYKSLFGLYSYYNNSNLDSILNDEWINRVIRLNSPFSILIQSEDLDIENTRLIKEYIYKSKTNQRHPSFIIDLYDDMVQINRNISVNPCILTIMGDGSILVDNSYENNGFNINDMSLIDILLKKH